MWKRMLLIVLLFALSISIIGEGVISMANKYCNLQGTQKISESYNNINVAFDKVEDDINYVNQRVDNIITTPAEGVSAQEIIDARAGMTTLGQRLRNFDTQINYLNNNKATKAEVDSAVAESKAYTDTKVAAVASGSPKGIYATLTDLQNAYPTGTSGIYVVSDDGKWYYWNGSAWTEGGVYQATGIGDNTVRLSSTTFIDNMYEWGSGDYDEDIWFITSGNELISYPGIRSVFVPLISGEKYVIRVSGSHDRFLIAAVEDDSIGSSGVLIYRDDTKSEYAFVANSELSYLYIGVSASGQEPDLFVSIGDVTLGSHTLFANQTRMACVINNNDIIIDFDSGTITLEGIAWITNGSFYDLIISNYTLNIDFSGYQNQNMIGVWYDEVNKTHMVKPYNEIPRNGYLWLVIRNIDRKVVGLTSGIKIVSEQTNWDDNRFIIPDDIYLATDTTYSIMSYNFNLLPLFEKEIENVLFELPTPNKALQFKDSADLRIPYEMTFDTKMVGKHKKFTNSLNKDITIHVKDPSTVSNKTPKILMIGDSTTYSNLPATLKFWLNKWDITPTMIGTILCDNPQHGYEIEGIGAEYGEGWRGWRLADIAGEAKLTDNTPYIDPRNPFINTNGEWDFEYYMTQNGFTGVDIVIIQLGTNDIIGYSDSEITYEVDIDYGTKEYRVENNVLWLQKMIDSILDYNSNIKIAIIPPMPAGTSESFREEALLWAEQQQKAFKDNPNVYCLPNYIAFGIMGMASYDGKTKTPVSEDNNSYFTTLSTNVHPDGMGQAVNTLWTASWIIHVL